MVEILVVVAILVILLALALPVMWKVEREAKRTACLGNLREIGTALELYLGDHNGRFPDIALARADAGEEAETLETVLRPYLDDEEVFHCPADRELFAESGSSYLWNSTQSGRLKTDTSFLGNEDRPDLVPLVLDKESFHGERNGTNMLYADYRTSNKLTFDVSAR